MTVNDPERVCEQCGQTTRASNVYTCRVCHRDVCGGCFGYRPCTSRAEHEEVTRYDEMDGWTK